MTTEGLFTCRFWAPSWFYSQTQESGGRESRGKKSPFFLFHFPFSFKTLKKIYFFYICFSTSFLSGLDWRSQREREVSTFYTWKLVSNLQFFPFLLLSLHRIYRCCLFKLMAVFSWQPCPFKWFLWSSCYRQTKPRSWPSTTLVLDLDGKENHICIPNCLGVHQKVFYFIFIFERL